MTGLSAEPQFQLLLNKTSIEDHVQKLLSRLVFLNAIFTEKNICKKCCVFLGISEKSLTSSHEMELPEPIPQKLRNDDLTNELVI